MQTKRYAVRFPELEVSPETEVCIFSEACLSESIQIIGSTYESLGSVARLFVNKKRTTELRSQIQLQKTALDEMILQKEQQEKIRFEQESSRLQERLREKKSSMDVEFQRLMMDAKQKDDNLSFKFEEYMRASSVLRSLLESAEQSLHEYEKYIQLYSEELSTKREYIICCDRHNKCLALISKYLCEMV